MLWGGSRAAKDLVCEDKKLELDQVKQREAAEGFKCGVIRPEQPPRAIVSAADGPERGSVGVREAVEEEVTINQERRYGPGHITHD